MIIIMRFALSPSYIDRQAVPWSRYGMTTRSDKKAETHRRIVAAARALFKRHGYDSVSVAMVMEAAGLTHGAFYAHFSSKSALHAEAMDTLTFSEALEARVKASDDPLGTLIDGYLSEQHRRDPAIGCAVAALAGDAALGKDEARTLVARGIAGLGEVIAQIGGLDADTALALTTHLVGALVIARSVDDPALAARILETGRLAARQMVGRARPTHGP